MLLRRRTVVDGQAPMFSAAWFDELGISKSQKVKIMALIVASSLLALTTAIFLASPVMSALGLSARLG